MTTVKRAVVQERETGSLQRKPIPGRPRDINIEPEHLLLDTLLERVREQGLLKARGRQRTDSTHVLAVIRALNRLALVIETLRLPSMP